MAESRIPDMLLTPKEVADYLSISEESLAQNRFHDTEGRIPHVKVGSRVRYRLSALLQYLEDNTHGQPLTAPVTTPVMPANQPARTHRAKRV